MCLFTETAMGTNLDTSDSEASEYKKGIYRLGELIVYRVARLWMHPPFIFRFTETGKMHDELVKKLHAFTTKVIRERRKERNASGNTLSVEELTNDSAFMNPKKKLAMLDLLLLAEAEGKIDEEGIREEVDTFMFEVR